MRPDCQEQRPFETDKSYPGYRLRHQRARDSRRLRLWDYDRAPKMTPMSRRHFQVEADLLPGREFAYQIRDFRIPRSTSSRLSGLSAWCSI
jgi:hypothetical protein